MSKKLSNELIDSHISIKKSFKNYPRVPRAILTLHTPAIEGEEVQNYSLNGHQESVWRGFMKRVSNFENDHLPHLLN